MIRNKLNGLKSIFRAKRTTMNSMPGYYEEFLLQDAKAKEIDKHLHEKAKKQNPNNILIAIRQDPKLQAYQKELENRYYHFLESKGNDF